MEQEDEVKVIENGNRKIDFKKLTPVLVMAVMLPVLGALVLNRQTLLSGAYKKCEKLTEVRINPETVTTQVEAAPTYFSALAFTTGRIPVFKGVTYEWGISSSNSTGDLQVQGKLAVFVPQNPGRADVFVKARNDCTKRSVLFSIPVVVEEAIALKPGEYRRVFVTREKYSGELGGIEGADGLCQVLANTAGLPGRWMAWLSGTGEGEAVRSRFGQEEKMFILTDGSLVAKGWTELLTKPLLHPINIDQDGQLLTEKTISWNVWTGTNVYGYPSAPFATGICSNFTGTSGTGLGGSTTAVGSNWTNVPTEEHSCKTQHHLYCFEQ